METVPGRETETDGQRILMDLARAVKEKDLAQLRAVSTRIHAIVEVGKCKCCPVGDDELKDILSGGRGYLAIVGTGSAGSRVVVGDGELRMPFSHVDAANGYGTAERQAFKKLFNISDEAYPAILIPKYNK